MRQIKASFLMVCAGVFVALLIGVARADDQPATQPMAIIGGPAATQPVMPALFMRFVDDGHGGGALQTAHVAFKDSQGREVDLIAAVHIGEKAYYTQLNQDFQKYDAVLYELIKPRDAAPPTLGSGSTSDNPISKFQTFLKTALDLDFQLDDVDYTAPNFVHADLDKETFERLQEERGETFTDLMLKQLVKAMTNPPPQAAGDEPTMKDVVHLMTAPDGERQIKVVIAKQLGDMDTAAMGLDGPGGSVIVTERNKAAMQTLDDTLGKGAKKVAIFYGAAHMPDMASRLEAEGFKPVATGWTVAWDLTIRADQPSAIESLLDNLLNANDADNSGPKDNGN